MKETDPSLKVSTVVSYFQPSNAKSVRFLLLVGPISFLVYYSYRVLISWFFRGSNILQNTEGIIESLVTTLLASLCTSVLGMVFVFIGVVIVSLQLFWLLFPIIHIFRYFRRNHFVAPLVPFFVGMIVAFLVPLPTRPPMTYTERMFHDHRADYERVAELVQTDQLGNLEDGENGRWSITLPEELRHLSHGGAVLARSLPAARLTLEFYLEEPYEYSETIYLILYIEIPEAVDEVHYCSDDGGSIHAQLGEHWFFCTYWHD